MMNRLTYSLAIASAAFFNSIPGDCEIRAVTQLNPMHSNVCAKRTQGKQIQSPQIVDRYVPSIFNDTAAPPKPPRITTKRSTTKGRSLLPQKVEPTKTRRSISPIAAPPSLPLIEEEEEEEEMTPSEIKVADSYTPRILHTIDIHPQVQTLTICNAAEQTAAADNNINNMLDQKGDEAIASTKVVVQPESSAFGFKVATDLLKGILQQATTGLVNEIGRAHV